MAAVPSRSCGMAESSAGRWQLSTLAGCSLAIGRYPRFSYNASGGGGLSQPAAAAAAQPTALALRFAPERLQIPALDWRSTRFLGLPLPPGLSIAITPDRLEGELDPSSGQIQLHFRARFRFRIGSAGASLYTAPDLLVATTLLSGPCQGQRHRASGQPRNAAGEARLVGIARVEPCGDPWLDRFLGLPDEALAELHCRLSPQP